MSDNVWRMYSPNLICVCVNEADMGEYMGVIWHQYDDKPIKYRGAMDLMRKMDALYEEWDFPQSSTVFRSFTKTETSRAERDVKREGLHMDVRRIQEKSGELGTFVVYVKYRQNSTWQGEVVWAEKKQKQHFRSALELLKLIDGALDESAGVPAQGEVE